MTARGGDQVIPRPPLARPGGPAPWSVLPEPERRFSVDDLRGAFQGRVGIPSVVESVDLRGSAVLAPLYEEDGELFVVLTRRSWALRSHTGQVSFPGGACDEDESAVQAALREAHEEIGLDPASVEVLGELDHLMTVVSQSFIVPFVGLLPGRPRLTPNASEVDAVLEVPVRELLLDEVYREEVWPFTIRPPWLPEHLMPESGTERPIFFFELVGDTVWGATASMLRQLLSLALGLDVGIDHA